MKRGQAITGTLILLIAVTVFFVSFGGVITGHAIVNNPSGQSLTGTTTFTGNTIFTNTATFKGAISSESIKSTGLITSHDLVVINSVSASDVRTNIVHGDRFVLDRNGPQFYALRAAFGANAYACLDYQGRLYRSQLPCV